MIDRKFITKNLDPEVFMKLGEVLGRLAPPEKKLHLLTDGRRIIRCCDSENRIICLEGDCSRIDESFAAGLFAADGALDEILVYSLEALKEYYRKIQSVSCIGLESDHYLSFLWDCLEEQEGIRIFRTHPRRKPLLFRLQKMLEPLPENHLSLVRITAGGEELFHVVLTVKSGRIVCVETLGENTPAMLEAETGLPCHTHLLAVDNISGL